MTKNRRAKRKARAAMSALGTNYTRARRTVSPSPGPTGPAEAPPSLRGSWYADADDFELVELAAPSNRAPVTAAIGFAGSGAGALRDILVDDFLAEHPQGRVIAFDPQQIAGDGLIFPRWALDDRVEIWDQWVDGPGLSERVEELLSALDAASGMTHPTLVSLSHLYVGWPYEGSEPDFFGPYRAQIDATLARLVRQARSTRTQVILREERFALPTDLANACTVRVLMAPQRVPQLTDPQTWDAMFSHESRPVGSLNALPHRYGWVSVAGSAPRPAHLFDVEHLTAVTAR